MKSTTITQAKGRFKTHWNIKFLVVVLNIAAGTIVGIATFIFRIIVPKTADGSYHSSTHTCSAIDNYYDADPHTLPDNGHYIPAYHEDPNRDPLYLSEGFPPPFNYHNDPDHPR